MAIVDDTTPPHKTPRSGPTLHNSELQQERSKQQDRSSQVLTTQHLHGGHDLGADSCRVVEQKLVHNLSNFILSFTRLLTCSGQSLDDAGSARCLAEAEIVCLRALGIMALLLSDHVAAARRRPLQPVRTRRPGRMLFSALCRRARARAHTHTHTFSRSVSVTVSVSVSVSITVSVSVSLASPVDAVTLHAPGSHPRTCLARLVRAASTAPSACKFAT